MKILHLIDSGGLYGAEKMLLTLVAEQLKQGLHPMILSAGEPGMAEKAIEAEARRLQLPITPWRMKPGLNLREAWKIIQWARAAGYQLLHSHGYKFNILMGLIPKSLRRLPLIATLHGYVNAARYSKLWIYERLDRFLLPRLDRVCLVSSHMQSIPTLSRIPTNRLAVIPNGLPELPDTSPQPLDDDLARFLQVHQINLLAVGRLSPEKNFQAIFHAMATPLLQDSAIGLCLVGEGGQREPLQALAARLGLTDKIRFLGYRQDVPHLMPHFDWLVMPSLTEGLPITLLEAMRAGLPVIASAVGGVPDALDGGRAGVLIQPGDVEALASAIATPKVAAIGFSDNAKVNFKAKFSAYSMSVFYIRVYMELLNNG